MPVSQRYRRDAARARAGGPIDYPTEQDVRDAPELAYRRRLQEQADALAAAMPAILRSEARVEACSCPDECFVTVCIPTCPCRCEAPAC
ncbi:MAG TPA: hypothetical protein P5181_04735 [Dermatophilaceae bacterium]|nr:hypothetical protein [Dermatophilaceae bacterium]